MKEKVIYNPRQQVRTSDSAENFKNNKVYKDAVDSIEVFALKQRELLIDGLNSLENTPDIIIGERERKFNGKKVKGIVLLKSEPGSRIGNSNGNSIVLVPGEGIVRMSWNVSYPFSYPNWEKRSEVSAQDYIKYSPSALLEIARAMKEGNTFRSQELF